MVSKRKWFNRAIAVILLSMTLFGVGFTFYQNWSLGKEPDYTKMYEALELQPLKYEYPKKLEKYHQALQKIEKGERPKEFNAFRFAEFNPIATLDMSQKTNRFTPIKTTDILAEDGLVYVGRVTCQFCNVLVQRSELVLNQLDLAFRYVDTDKLSQEELADLNKEFKLESVPTIYLVKDGKIEYRFDERFLYMSYPDMARQLTLAVDYVNGVSDTLPLVEKVQ